MLSSNIYPHLGVRMGVTSTTVRGITPMPLSDTTIRNAKPGEKPVKLADEKGLFLLIVPAGGKWWRLKYRFGGKEKLLSLGTYLRVSLKDARDKRDEVRKVMKAA